MKRTGLELENENKKISQKLHAFNIMQGGFKKEDAEKVITEEIVNHIEKDPRSSRTRLLSFLALINSYVPGLHLSKHLCQEFIDETKWPDEEKLPLEMQMKPFGDLIVIFSEGEQKADCIRLAHPMIADACLKLFTEHNMTKSHIASDLKNMVKSNEINYVQICKILLVTRPKGVMENEKFSKLVLDEGKNNTNKCIHLLHFALNVFSKDPFYPQALARFYYNMMEKQEEHKFKKAEKWAREANERDDKNNSYIKDTLGQVLKNHLIWQLNKTPENKKKCLAIAKAAIKAFQEEVDAAENESQDNTKFNYRGHFGFLQVCKNIYKEEYISDVESKYNFFEWYLAYSKPSINKEEPDYFCKDVEDSYKCYFKQEEQTDEMSVNMKKMKSFAGLFHFLKSDINVLEQNWNAIVNPQSDKEEHIVSNALANIILSQFDKPCENLLDLQARLKKIWTTDRSPEFYLLILLLFWPDKAQPGIPDSPNLEVCVQYMFKSYEKKYQKYLRGRYLVPLFFLGTESGLQRLVHTKLQTTDLELLTEGDENVEVSYLQRINGQVKNHEVFADQQQIQVTPHNKASVNKDGRVSFYIGFTIRGPVAYNIRYDEYSK